MSIAIGPWRLAPSETNRQDQVCSSRFSSSLGTLLKIVLVVALVLVVERKPERDFRIAVGATRSVLVTAKPPLKSPRVQGGRQFAPRGPFSAAACLLSKYLL